jgi:hypothetical protein
MKFEIGNKVKIIGFPKVKCTIFDCWINKLENLRMTCPNCHSQTETYCGKNK